VARLDDSKTGPKPLLLPSPALEVLRRLERVEGNPYCLPGRHRGKPLNNPHTLWVRICATAGIQGTRLHDLRHTFLTWLVHLGVPLPVIQQVVHHATLRTTEGYLHMAGGLAAQAAAQGAQALTMAGARQGMEER
jgi:integrase